LRKDYPKLLRRYTVGDFNRDGRPDLAVANNGSDTVSVLFCGASGFSLTAVKNYGVGDMPRSVAVGDFDRDGRLDLVVANYNSDNVSILLNHMFSLFLPLILR